MLRSSKLVRQALAYGIDRAEIVRALWGALEPRYPPLHSLVHLNTERGYAANWGGYAYRPRRAHGLLERAGCRRGSDGIYVCGGNGSRYGSLRPWARRSASGRSSSCSASSGGWASRS